MINLKNYEFRECSYCGGKFFPSLPLCFDSCCNECNYNFYSNYINFCVELSYFSASLVKTIERSNHEIC